MNSAILNEEVKAAVEEIPQENWSYKDYIPGARTLADAAGIGALGATLAGATMAAAAPIAGPLSAALTGLSSLTGSIADKTETKEAELKREKKEEMREARAEEKELRLEARQDAREARLEAQRVQKENEAQMKRYNQSAPGITGSPSMSNYSPYRRARGEIPRNMPLATFRQGDIRYGGRDRYETKAATERLRIMIPNDKYAIALENAGRSIDILAKHPPYVKTVSKYANDKLTSKKKYTHIGDVLGAPKVIVVKPAEQPSMYDPDNRYGELIDKKIRPEYNYMSTVQV
jgi:hypothetical protein